MYKYWLPGENNEKKEYTTENNSIVIIGANGSGKSKLGAWMERQSWDGVHRIGAQRDLNFNENIPLKNYSEAENWVFFGSGDANDHQKNSRWGWGHYTTKLINDFDNVLSALIALKNNEISQFHEACRAAGDNRTNWPNVPITTIDRLKEIWSSVLPNRELVEDDSRLYARFTRCGEGVQYSATEMSDGERAVLYLSAQVLCVPKNKVLIIDEPEVHLHRSIMNRLWKKLESCRPDCLFVYITHDLQFAAAHGGVDKIWIKDFDGVHWTFEPVVSEKLPEELTFEILGSRKNVLFVEGERNSYDYQLYTLLYPDYLVIPCGGCSQVVARTRAFNKSPSLHDCEVYGLIDRDYRSDAEIAALEKDRIYALEVAEVENLFLVEELLRFMAERFGEKNPTEAVERIKQFVIGTKFANMIERQICQSVVSEIKYRLSCIEISVRDEAEAKRTLQDGYDSIRYEDIRNEKESSFKNALENRDYGAVLRLFNEKGIAKAVGKELGIINNEYQDKVINLLSGDSREAIERALTPSLPREIPRRFG